MIIDAWAQHPSLRHSQNPIFDSLRRWSKADVPTKPLPLEATIAAMDEANVGQSLISADKATSFLELPLTANKAAPQTRIFFSCQSLLAQSHPRISLPLHNCPADNDVAFQISFK